MNVRSEIDAYIKARRKVLQIEADHDVLRKERGCIGELSARQWGTAMQKKNKAVKKLLAAIDRAMDEQKNPTT